MCVYVRVCTELRHSVTMKKLWGSKGRIKSEKKMRKREEEKKEGVRGKRRKKYIRLEI